MRRSRKISPPPTGETVAPAKVGVFGNFVKWILHDGQNYAHALHYGTLLNEVIILAGDQLSQVHLANDAATGPSCKASLGLAPHQNTIPTVRNEEEAGYLSSD